MQIIEEFIKKESSSGVLLIVATIFALIFSNTFLSPLYQSFLHIPIEIRVGSLHIDKSLYHWVNDGLMAIFFLLIGLEVKREILIGHLSTYRQLALPSFAALGGMLVPAVIYLIFNINNTAAIDGWAIPTATDIAFSLGILTLLGNRVPISLKIFLMALAIIDDLGAIVIIAFFYTSELSTLSISVAFISLTLLIAFNYFGVSKKAAYFIVGTILWISVLKSGVHATLAGVALAFTIPLNSKDENKRPISPLNEIEHNLHSLVAFFILPLFAFVNAGVNITEISLNQMAGPVPIGIICGLFLGKQIGVFGFSWIAIKLKLAKLPKDCNWIQLYGVSALTGIGFTMSLFITSLAFEDESIFQYTDKLAVLIGSLLSGVVGYSVLKTHNKYKKVLRMFDIYESNEDDTARYLLGSRGDSTIIVVGLNPNTASSEKSDMTISEVRKAALNAGYCSFVMTNLYPLRSTDPHGLPDSCNEQLLKENIKHIERIASAQHPPTFWAAWGSDIVLRPYLKQSMLELNEMVERLNGNWVQFGELTQKKHPRHPSRLRYAWDFKEFDFAKYKKSLHNK